jgi:hypothetical protein
LSPHLIGSFFSDFFLTNAYNKIGTYFQTDGRNGLKISKNRPTSAVLSPTQLAEDPVWVCDQHKYAGHIANPNRTGADCRRAPPARAPRRSQGGSAAGTARRRASSAAAPLCSARCFAAQQPRGAELVAGSMRQANVAQRISEKLECCV